MPFRITPVCCCGHAKIHSMGNCVATEHQPPSIGTISSEALVSERSPPSAPNAPPATHSHALNQVSERREEAQDQCDKPSSSNSRGSETEQALPCSRSSEIEPKTHDVFRNVSIVSAKGCAAPREPRVPESGRPNSTIHRRATFQSVQSISEHSNRGKRAIGAVSTDSSTHSSSRNGPSASSAESPLLHTGGAQVLALAPQRISPSTRSPYAFLAAPGQASTQQAQAPPTPFEKPSDYLLFADSLELQVRELQNEEAKSAAMAGLNWTLTKAGGW